jgi:hypothetical protein
MQPLSSENKAALEEYRKQAATILKQHPETEKLKDFERIEVELKTQLLNRVKLMIAEFF